MHVCFLSHTHTHTHTPHAGVIVSHSSPVGVDDPKAFPVFIQYLAPKNTQSLTHIDASSRIKYKGSWVLTQPWGLRFPVLRVCFLGQIWALQAAGLLVAGCVGGQGRGSCQRFPPPPSIANTSPSSQGTCPEFAPWRPAARRVQLLDATLREKGVSLGSGFLFIQGHAWGGAARGDKDFSRLLPGMSSSIDARFQISLVLM